MNRRFLLFFIALDRLLAVVIGALLKMNLLEADSMTGQVEALQANNSKSAGARAPSGTRGIEVPRQGKPSEVY